MAERYSLSVTQLMVLLKGAGYTTLSGFDTDNPALDDAGVLRALNALMKSGVITAGGDSFEMNHEIKNAVGRIGGSDGFITLRTGNDRLPDRCIYPGDALLVCTLRSSDRGHLSLCHESVSELYEELTDEGYLPARRDEGLFDEEALIDYERELYRSLPKSRALTSSSCILLSLDVMNGDADAPYLRIIDYYFYHYLVFFDGERIRRAPYSPEGFKEWFERMMTL